MLKTIFFPNFQILLITLKFWTLIMISFQVWCYYLIFFLFLQNGNVYLNHKVNNNHLTFLSVTHHVDDMPSWTPGSLQGSEPFSKEACVLKFLFHPQQMTHCQNMSFGLQITSWQKYLAFRAFQFSKFQLNDCEPVSSSPFSSKFFLLRGKYSCIGFLNIYLNI